VVVVADSSKFEHRALAPVCALDDVDLIVTDDNLDPQIRRLYGSRVHCVPLDGAADNGPVDGPRRRARRPDGAVA
jgi:hypothetical protein